MMPTKLVIQLSRLALVHIHRLSPSPTIHRKCSSRPICLSRVLSRYVFGCVHDLLSRRTSIEWGPPFSAGATYTFDPL